MPNESSICQARIDEFEALCEMLDRANEYSLQKSAVTQWTLMDRVYGQLREQIERGECYTLLDNRQVCAAICVSEEDVYMWEDEGLDGTALYFHKLMKDPVLAPSNVGKTLIGFAAQEGTRRDKTVLRCDTKSNQDHLISYYSGLGLKEKRRTFYPGTDMEAVLFEADISTILIATAADS